MTANDFLDQDGLLALGLGHIGRGVQISRHAVFYSAEGVSVGDHSRIDAFAVVSGAGGVVIGRHAHISTHVVIVGNGGATVGDYSALAPRVTLLTSSDDFSGEFVAVATAPENVRRVTSARIVIGNHVAVGAGTIIMPGVTIEDSAAVAAASFVKGNVTALAIVGGIPARTIGRRSSRHVELVRSLDP